MICGGPLSGCTVQPLTAVCSGPSFSTLRVHLFPLALPFIAPANSTVVLLILSLSLSEWESERYSHCNQVLRGHFSLVIKQFF